MRRTNTVKYLCYLCCVLLLLSAMPDAGVPNADTDDGVFYIISARTVYRFSAYMPHSLSRGNIPDKCVWIKSGESSIGINHSRELIKAGSTEICASDKFCTLLKAAGDNHLSYCKREVYHMLI